MTGTLAFLSSAVRFPTSSSPTIRARRNPTIVAFASASTVDARKAANLYEVLRIEKTASLTEIKTAYRNLAKRFHPDAGSDGRDFMEIHEAYSTLSDPTSRSLYDRSIGSAGRFRFAPSENCFQTRRKRNGRFRFLAWISGCGVNMMVESN
ncbi:chaperone protein dnaJ 11, chloroplastic [Cinnamomum micranthum f. kanehirae]|uniref:Chaperone protein dnaJ 11, chloroplastic n=1 Tax=Cinnamomum micranthum f. kanehirae TaxID=337451 RepID=A0A3S3R3Y9_9MAGN|nr:chaperone protein dnaJ 11, chloroplastic [Cinnamomum micranthum f. kanehirae]